MSLRIRALDESLSINFDSLANCYKDFWNQLSSSFSSMDVKQATEDKSKSIKNSILEATQNISGLVWFIKDKERDGLGPFKIDGTYLCNEDCGTRHVINIVLCLYNREAIGTNFLKLEVAALKEIRISKGMDFNDENVLGILITFDRGFLESENYPNWDSSYGDATEYRNAYKNFYKSIIRANLISMRLHLS